MKNMIYTIKYGFGIYQKQYCHIRREYELLAEI